MVSPSGSVAVGVQVRVLDKLGLVGEIATLLITGALLLMVTALEVMAVPVLAPSVGVAVQVTVLPREKLDPVRVLLVWPLTVLPLTAQV